MTPLRTAIIGLGPVGSILAVMLKRAGCEVALCVRNQVKRDKILSEGIRLENVLNATAEFDQVYPDIASMAELNPDFIFFATKTYHLPESIQQVAQLNLSKTYFVSAQNGIDVEDMLTETFGESRTLRMVVNFAGALLSPNTVKVTFFQPPNYIGSVNDACPEKAVAIADLLNASGMDTRAVDSQQLRVRVWEKTILNASVSAICGVSRLTMAEAMAEPDTVELVEQIIGEAVLVAEQEKIRFSDDFLRKCLVYLKRGGDHFPSLALDLIQNRPTEIDYFNGKIVSYGRKHYTRTSLNLSFTNVVKAMSNKNIISRQPGTASQVNRKILEKGLVHKQTMPLVFRQMDCFLGVDLGSAFTKFTVIDESGKPLFRYVLTTITADNKAQENVLAAIHQNFRIVQSCATGYGRKYFEACDMVKTEINCAAAGVSQSVPGEKNIIDIGGEDIKIIRCDAGGNVEQFYMNDKCAAGTGSFLSEIAERAQISVEEMSRLASHSAYDKPLNSFCTVFAKTEIMNWIFDGMSREDIARGIYLSIAGKISKMRIDPGIPCVLIGGVAAHHPYLKNILNEMFHIDLRIAEAPQYVVSHGAALLALRSFQAKAGAEAKKRAEKTLP
ncbi:MAG: 2-dehydropantoate 2-reductase [Saprospiraceae bacterium]|nr:2-dehydropantoate 2-reductase [Saprospiraceae bacterium]